MDHYEQPAVGDNGEKPAEECIAMVSSDPDDATAVAGNQQAGGQYGINMIAANGEDITTPSLNPEPQLPPIPNQIEVGEEDGKPSARVDNREGTKTTSSFAQLVKSWETYIADAQNVDTFQPMQMLQNLRMCGAGHELPRLTLAPSTDFTVTTEGQDPFEPIILRHTHSTPHHYRPYFFGEYDSSGMPPPSELNATRRSSSTPSRGSAFQQFSSRSAFAAHMHSNSNLGDWRGGSAFGFPLHRSAYSGVSTESSIRNSAFNPVPSSLSPTHEEPLQQENTSIEVMDLGLVEAVQQESNANCNEEKGEVEVQIETRAEETDIDFAKPKQSAAARAARFLSDVGVLRRKKKGARSSIMTVISADAGNVGKKIDLKNEAESKKGKDSIAPTNHSQRQESDSEDHDQNGDFALPPTPSYHQLDSDVDEEYDRYQSIENSARDSDDSSRTVPSPDYHPMEDDVRRPAVRIHVSSNLPSLPRIAERSGFPTNTTSPNPDHLGDDDHSGTRSSSTHSPGGFTRSSATTNTSTSGHTTQATSITSTTGNTSGNSQISDTDREVMETIKEGKRRRRQESHQADEKTNTNATVTVDTSSSSSSPTNGYTSLSGSPGPLRDGANLVADRFFTNAQSELSQGNYLSGNSSVSVVVAGSGPAPFSMANSRARTSPVCRKNNTNVSPASCSWNSTEEKPPTFVSYLDRQNASDLTSLRAGTEASRCDAEEREDSPAQIVGFSAFLDAANDGQENAMSVLPKLILPTAEHLYSMLDKFRSRPPRSPAKGLRTMTPTTPPPRLGSPVYHHHQLSPPRKIIDHRLGPNVSRPYVVRTMPSTQRVVLVSPVSYVRPTTPLVCIPVGGPNYDPSQNRPLPVWQEQTSPHGYSLRSRTYEEHSIEILKEESKD